MKGMKKLLSILMVLTLVLSLGATALAATVTIDGTKQGLNADHTYKAYQIFTGTQATNPTDQDSEPMGNIEWGTGINYTEFLEALKESDAFGDPNPFTDCVTAMDVAKAIAKANADGSFDTKAFGKLALDNKVPSAAIPVTKDASGNYSAEVGTGYYVISDETNPLPEGQVRNDIVVEVVGDVTITAKNEGPTSDKKVKDINDSTETTANWHDSADHDIGDTVEYRLHAKIPATALKAYEKYYLYFEDVISAGLTYKNDAEIWLGEKDVVGSTNITSSFTGPDTTAISDNSYGAEYNGGNHLEWKCENIKDITGCDGSKDVDIYIYYTATLNDNAKVGDTGNPNKFQIKYNRNPNGNEEGTTPWDINIVFTYNFKTNKVDGAGAALDGAEFKLLKKLAAAPAGIDPDTSPDVVKNLKKLGDLSYKYYYDGADYWQVIDLNKSGSVAGKTGDVFTKKGLDDGIYKLVETETPAGYNTADAVDFTITATHNDGDPPTFGDLTNGASGTEFTFTKTADDPNTYNVSGSIKNERGVELPETGGIGTTIFYVAGAILVAGAVILLVTKKRVSGTEK